MPDPVQFIFLAVVCCEAACSKTKIASFTRSTDDGKRVLLVQGQANNLGKFLKVSEILQSGRTFQILMPEGKERDGWRSLVLILRSFGAAGRLPSQLAPSVNVQNFPPLESGAGGVGTPVVSPASALHSVETIQSGREWTIKAPDQGRSLLEVGWNCAVICIMKFNWFCWKDEAVAIASFLHLESPPGWRLLGSDRALFVTQSMEEVKTLCKWGAGGVLLGTLIFFHGNRVDLQWARIEVEGGDLRKILRVLLVVDHHCYYAIVIPIDEELRHVGGRGDSVVIDDDGEVDSFQSGVGLSVGYGC